VRTEFQLKRFKDLISDKMIHEKKSGHDQNDDLESIHQKVQRMLDITSGSKSNCGLVGITRKTPRTQSRGSQSRS
jgi:hypothetical protein